MLNSRRVARHLATVLFLVIAVVVVLPRAYGQADFTLAASAPYPSAVDPGGSSISTITVNTINHVSAGSVALSCVVAPVQTNGVTCSILSAVTPPASPTLTITTTGLTPPTLYTITVAGTDASTTVPLTATVNFSVLVAAPAYTVSDTTPSPSSVQLFWHRHLFLQCDFADGHTRTGLFVQSRQHNRDERGREFNPHHPHHRPVGNETAPLSHFLCIVAATPRTGADRSRAVHDQPALEEIVGLAAAWPDPLRDHGHDRLRQQH